MFWSLLARLLARPSISAWIIARSRLTPYTHITSLDGFDVYMYRWWLFNPYPGAGNEIKRYRWLPSIRVHHICREDGDRHLHDHPWNARTFILHGNYVEERQAGHGRNLFVRYPGSTAALKFGQYHRIASVSDEGVWTLFVTWKYRGTWGFLVDGVKVPWRKYLGVPKV